MCFSICCAGFSYLSPILLAIWAGINAVYFILCFFFVSGRIPLRLVGECHYIEQQCKILSIRKDTSICVTLKSCCVFCSQEEVVGTSRYV